MNKSVPTTLIIVSLAVSSLANRVIATVGTECNPNDPQQFCSPNFSVNGGGLSAVGGYSVGSTGSVDSPRMSVGGLLSYEDQTTIENRAWNSLNSAITFRKRISPYQQGNTAQDFNTLVRQFFAKKSSADLLEGFNNTLVPGETVTLSAKLDNLEKDLRSARDSYAYLAIYADQNRFRPDLGCTTSQPGSVIDRCDFASRLRDSVREATYLRLIFGQQLTADSIGLFFGANVVGGEDYIQLELNKLELGLKMYEQAHQTLVEGMNVAVGSDCFVSDFFAEQEWILLSRINEGLQTTRNQIVTRHSMKDGLVNPSSFRLSAAEQYVNMVGLAGTQKRVRSNICPNGSQLSDESVKRMVTNLSATVEQARKFAEGYNILGFNEPFVPVLKYDDLVSQAENLIRQAKAAQDEVRANNREEELNRDKLKAEIDAINLNYLQRISRITGCPNDASLISCAAQNRDSLRACLLDSSVSLQGTYQDQYDSCLRTRGVSQQNVGNLNVAAERVRTAALGVYLAYTQTWGFSQSADFEKERFAKVRDAIIAGQSSTLDDIAFDLLSKMESAMESAVLNAVTGGGAVKFELATTNANNQPDKCCNKKLKALAKIYIAYQVAGLHGAVMVAKAEMISAQKRRATNSKIQIENANSEAKVKELMLEMQQQHIKFILAGQESRAQFAEFDSQITELNNLLSEFKRSSQYTVDSLAEQPANRLVRDSSRLNYAFLMQQAQMMTYLATKRADYETAGDIYSNTSCPVTLSAIYRVRIAEDLNERLNCLKTATSFSKGINNANITPQSIKISVAINLLGLTDAALRKELGSTATQSQIEQERLKRFRKWVADHTTSEVPPLLVFDFSTSIAPDGPLLGNGTGFERFWQMFISGKGDPLPESDAFRMNLLTEQTDQLQYRQVTVSQKGVTHLRSGTGCILDYQLIDPAVFVGIARTDLADTASLPAAINSAFQPSFYTPLFNWRPVSATGWRVNIPSQPPPLSNAENMDFQKLKDIEILISATRRSSLLAREGSGEACQ